MAKKIVKKESADKSKSKSAKTLKKTPAKKAAKPVVKRIAQPKGHSHLSIPEVSPDGTASNRSKVTKNSNGNHINPFKRK